MIGKRIILPIIVFALSMSFCYTVSAYNDISGNWAEEEILLLNSQNLLYDDNTGIFRPEAGITRGEAAYFFSALKIKELYDREVFYDVGKDNPLYNEIRHAVATGLMRAYPDGSFRSDLPLTRNEAFVIASYLLPVDYSTEIILNFSDMDTVSAYALHAIELLLRHNIIAEPSNNTIRGTAPITRSEFVHLFATLFGGNLTSDSANEISANIERWLNQPYLFSSYSVNLDGLEGESSSTSTGGVISGYITVDEIGVDGATVTIQGRSSIISVITDYNGYYFIDSLPDGTYNITVSKLDYPIISNSFEVKKSNRVTMPFALGNEYVDAYAEIVGFVYDVDTGDKLENATISVTINSKIYTANTDKSGLYWIHLPVGNYTVTVEKNGYAKMEVIVPIDRYRVSYQDFYMRSTH